MANFRLDRALYEPEGINPVTFYTGTVCNKQNSNLHFYTFKDWRNFSVLQGTDIARIASQFLQKTEWTINDIASSGSAFGTYDVLGTNAGNDNSFYLSGITCLFKYNGASTHHAFYRHLPFKHTINMDCVYIGHPYVFCWFDPNTISIYAQGAPRDTMRFQYCPVPFVIYKKQVTNQLQGYDTILSGESKFIYQKAESIDKTYNSWIHFMEPHSSRIYNFVNMPIRVVETYEASADYFTMRNGYSNNSLTDYAYNSSLGTKKVFNHNIRKRIIVQPICHNVSRYYLTEEYKDVIAALHLSPFVFVTLDGEFCRVVPTDTKFSYKDMYKNDPLDLSVEFELLK